MERLPGDYGVHVKFDDEHVPDSPTNVHIVPHSEGANKVCVTGLKDRGLSVSLQDTPKHENQIPIEPCQHYNPVCAETPPVK